MAGPQLTQVDRGTLTKVIVAASVGNFVEWFDFAVYGFMATIVAERFFASDDPTVALLNTFAVFAVAFALRPLGGAVFGVLGDRLGRKRMLSLTVILMAGSTTLIGFLPTYETVGLLAPLLLCLARCVQGFSAGGEYAGACAYVLEHSPKDRKARYSSFLPVSTFSAFAFAAVVAFVFAAVLSDSAMDAWGWRIPFLIAAPLGAFGFYIRLRLDETPVFDMIEKRSETVHAPLRETLRTQSTTMLRLCGFIAVTALSFYTFTTYMTTYLQVVVKFDRATALFTNVAALLVAAALAPLTGRLSDRIGRKPTMVTACLLLAVLVLPAYWLTGQGVAAAVGGQVLLALGAVTANVVTAVLLAELFPAAVRYSASAITYNIGYALFGGTAPFIATYLVSRTDEPLSPAIYLLVVALLGLVAVATLPETSKRSLSDDRDTNTTDMEVV